MSACLFVCMCLKGAALRGGEGVYIAAWGKSLCLGRLHSLHNRVPSRSDTMMDLLVNDHKTVVLSVVSASLMSSVRCC